MSTPSLPLLGGQICVIGRCNFHTGIGLHTFAFSELLSRHFHTCIQPTEPHLQSQPSITLPSGREVPVWRGSHVKASVFVDVLWNGVGDSNLSLVPDCGLRLACLVWDSDQLPDETVEIANTRFDGIICLSPHLEKLAKSSGITKPCITLPLPLFLEPLLARPFRRPDLPKIRLGSVAAFHPRKNVQLLVDAFLELYGKSEQVELVVHSNLSFSSEIDHLRARLEREKVENVHLSLSDLNNDQKINLIDSFDAFINLSRAEGYSVGAREAMALGKPCLLSAVGGHNDLIGTPGVFGVVADIAMPARYPEVDNRVFGRNFSVTREDAITGLASLVDYLHLPPGQDVFVRRDRAADFSFSRLSTSVGALIKPDIAAFRPNKARATGVVYPPNYMGIARNGVRSAGGIHGSHSNIVQMHDGGFYSIFNSFFSHLVWDLQDDWQHRTLPDWDVKRFLERHGEQAIQSFCYGKPGDGNIWTKLFKPLFGLSKGDMNDQTILYQDAKPPQYVFNERREPLLTYVHAAKLYDVPWFAQMRRQYKKVYDMHIRLEDSIQREIDDFKAEHFSDFSVLGAHVRHPSHTVEQPNAVIAHADEYIARLKDLAIRKGYRENSDRWRIFLATDQDRVVKRFTSEFGDRLIIWKDARRTTDAEDSEFDSLTQSEKNVDGYQLQHIVARDQKNWSLDMAREVIRDTHLMASCESLFHVVSNVSTAVAYINPDCEMIYCANNRDVA